MKRSRHDNKAPPKLGDVVSGYELKKVLGDGSTAIVFFGQGAIEVALKVAKNDHPDVLLQFEHERRIAQKMKHAHICSLVDYGNTDEGLPFLCFALAQGRSLRAIMDEGPLPVHVACAIAEKVALALSSAHGHFVLHRDLKPANIYVDEVNDFDVRVLDFGLAEAMSQTMSESMAEDSRDPLSQGSSMVGTPGYAAPEQAGGKNADHRADLYSLGAVLWESINGKPMYTGSPFSILAQQQQAPAPLLKRAPHALTVLLKETLSRTPEKRPPSALVLAKRLQEFKDTAVTGSVQSKLKRWLGL